MKTALRTFCILVIIAMAGVTAVMVGQNQATAADKPDYYEMLAKLKNNDTSVDFQALRLAYTKTPDYKPYGADNSTKDAAFEALRKKNYAEAVKHAQTVLETNYVDLDVHLLCRIAYREMGNSERYTFHTSVLQGLVGSLYASGDGTTAEKAIVVISVPEEYFVINANGLKSVKTSTLAANGHDYDRMDVESRKTGQKSVLYFNIDIPRQWLTKNLQKK